MIGRCRSGSALPIPTCYTDGTMGFYEIYVASLRYQKAEPLTYASEVVLQPGTVVVVPFGRQQVLGFVHAKVSKPSFACKPILRTLNDIVLPPALPKLFSWLMQYYPSASGAVAQLFLPGSLLTKKEETIAKITDDVVEIATKLQKIEPAVLPPLRPDQAAALKIITTSKHHHFLLHGETGSGKTRVYIERTLAAIQANKSVLILTPEIGLTPQLRKDFSDQFQNRVVIMHSNLTAKKRREYWLKIARATEPLIVIGPRSAMFSPVKNLGLIVMDEFHEPAYKQEQAPRYQTVRAAAALAKLHQSEVIYGSATPPVSEYFLAEQTNMPIIRMNGHNRGDLAAIETKIVNLTNKSDFGRHPFLSNTLLNAIEQSLTNKEQVLMYLNRRGTARLVICQNCGWQALCPNCDLPLTYHGDGHHLRCHTCGYRGTAPLSCPTCQSTDLQYRTMGTKALLETLQGFFPHATLQRFDTDLGVAERMDKHYTDVRAGKVDILVGTQMLGKGLDLPKLGLVGVVAADTSLYLPDFTAAERSYQLLHQVLGRVGRGHRKGAVIIQTYVPDNPILQAAIQKDYDTFYKAELIERKTFLFPPFCYLLKITTSRKSPESAEKAIRVLHHKLETTKLKLRLSDPAPSYFEHTHGMYHWQLVLKATDRKELLKALNALPAGNWAYDLDPANLL
jgi:primosomal protein N' (replication factor Y)